MLSRALAYRFAIAFGDLPSAPLRRIPAPQTTSGFAEARRKTITYGVVKRECCSLWQKHSAERECAAENEISVRNNLCTHHKPYDCKTTKDLTE